MFSFADGWGDPERAFPDEYEHANHSPLNTRPDFFVGREAADQTKC
jgi:hypothetical protein